MTTTADSREARASRWRRRNPLERDTLTLDDRISDRLNPVLVREIQQAMNGRIVMVTTIVASIAIIIVGFGVIVPTRHDMPGRGRQAFELVLQCLAPILLFVIPMRTFMSMREEVRGSTAEQLTLSNLRPYRIVFGKICSSMVLAGLYLALFAPLLAVSYIMRGVDLPTILITFYCGCLLTLGVTVAAAALGSACRFKGLQTLPVGLAALAAGGICGWTMVVLDGFLNQFERVVRSGEVGTMLTVVTVVAGLGIVFCWMCASSVLTHPHENRSTPLRLLCITTVVVFVAILWTLSPLP